MDRAVGTDHHQRPMPECLSMTAAWTISFTVMGAACLVNARRCGRRQCFCAEPLFWQRHFCPGSAAWASCALGDMVGVGFPGPRLRQLSWRAVVSSCRWADTSPSTHENHDVWALTVSWACSWPGTANDRERGDTDDPDYSRCQPSSPVAIAAAISRIPTQRVAIAPAAGLPCSHSRARSAIRATPP